MTINANGIFTWRAGIDQHYASLTDFSDATTIRTMLGFCEEYLTADTKMLEESRAIPENYQLLVETFADERQRVGEIADELRAWLAQYNLAEDVGINQEPAEADILKSI